MMKIFKYTFDFFASLRTAVWLLLGVILFLLYGAFVMPGGKAYGTLNFVPLFDWLRSNSLADTWWLTATIIVLSLLTANTLICSAESVFKKIDRSRWILSISPQVVHVGFLFILVAHLAGAQGSMKGTATAHEGSQFGLPNGDSMLVKSISVSLSAQGYVMDYRADVEYQSSGHVKSDYMAPNRPSFYKGYGLYLKQVQAFPVKSAELEISREPGAPWALAGGILFMVGTITLIVFRIKGEG